eukprot:g4805.t1
MNCHLHATKPFTTQISLYKVVIFVGYIIFSLTYVEGTDWGCNVASTTGTFTQSTDCAPLSDQVTPTGDLTITGNENTYTTLVAASGKRHFLVNSGAPTVTLLWLNLTGVSHNDQGGSIKWEDRDGLLNITHCVFYKNSVGSSSQGAAIRAGGGNTPFLLSLTDTKFIKNTAADKGGAVYFKNGNLKSHNVEFIENNGRKGGALNLYQVTSCTISNNLFISNTASWLGGGLAMYGDATATTVSISGTTFQQNTQTANGDNTYGGGGLYIEGSVTISIRECSFLQNEAVAIDQGHQIMTLKDSAGHTPSITLVNTNFTNIVDGTPNNFYGYDASDSSHGTSKYITTNDCSANPCTTSPFAGTCTARTNTKFGVLCSLNVSECSDGEFRNIQEVNESSLPPLVPSSCTAWTSCAAGKYVSTNGTKTGNRECTPCNAQMFTTSTNENSCIQWIDCNAGSFVSTPGSSSNNRVCTPCGNGKFTNAINLNACTNWTECGTILVNGTASTDRTCAATTTTTTSPTTTSGGNTVTTTTSPTTTSGGNTVTTTTSAGNIGGASTTTEASNAINTTTVGTTTGGIALDNETIDELNNELSGAVHMKEYCWLLPMFVTIVWGL